MTMTYTDVASPLGPAWSSPSATWQATLAEVDSMDLAVAGTPRAPVPSTLDAVGLGIGDVQAITTHGAAGDTGAAVVVEVND